MPIQKTLKTVLKNHMDNLTPVTKQDTTGTIILAEDYPNEVQKSIANLRFIYHNDATIRGLIFNNAITANHKFKISIREGYEDVPGIDEARAYIENRCKSNDWNLDEIITQTLTKAQRDRQCFIQIPIVGGQAHINPLKYDGENYDFLMIPDPSTGKIAGYVQKHPMIADFKNWQKMEWDDLVKKAEDVGETTSTAFVEEEIIHFSIIKEDGEGEGLLEAILDKIKDKWDYEGFAISVAQKTGAIAIVKIGDMNHEDPVQRSLVSKLLDVFNNRIKKTAVSIPDGVSVEQMSNSSLPDIPSYRKTVIDEIFLALQTPNGLFDTQGSTFASLKTASDTKTGYGVFLEYIRDLIKANFETKLIDKDLSLQKGFADCVGGIEIRYSDEDLESVEPITPSEADYSADNEDLEDSANNQLEDNSDEGGDE